MAGGLLFLGLKQESKESETAQNKYFLLAKLPKGKVPNFAKKNTNTEKRHIFVMLNILNLNCIMFLVTLLLSVTTYNRELTENIPYLVYYP